MRIVVMLLGVMILIYSAIASVEAATFFNISSNHGPIVYGGAAPKAVFFEKHIRPEDGYAFECFSSHNGTTLFTVENNKSSFLGSWEFILTSNLLAPGFHTTTADFPREGDFMFAAFGSVYGQGSSSYVSTVNVEVFQANIDYLNDIVSNVALQFSFEHCSDGVDAVIEGTYCYNSDYFDAQPVPEPATMIMLGLGSLGLVVMRKMK